VLSAAQHNLILLIMQLGHNLPGLLTQDGLIWNGGFC
jgi:hypothetical protein